MARYRFRSVSPTGVRGPWRRSVESAVRDAFYAHEGLGREIGGVTVKVDCRVAMAFAEKLIGAGWTFEKTGPVKK